MKATCTGLICRFAGGHAQAGRRPAILFQTNAVSAQVPTVLIVPMTTQLDALRFPGTVLIEADTQNNLRRASVALVFQLTAIDQRQVQAHLGSISAADLEAIRAALNEVSGANMP